VEQVTTSTGLSPSDAWSVVTDRRAREKEREGEKERQRERETEREREREREISDRRTYICQTNHSI